MVDIQLHTKPACRQRGARGFFNSLTVNALRGSRSAAILPVCWPSCRTTAIPPEPRHSCRAPPHATPASAIGTCTMCCGRCRSCGRSSSRSSRKRASPLCGPNCHGSPASSRRCPAAFPAALPRPASEPGPPSCASKSDYARSQPRDRMRNIIPCC